jgi:hypothetical protein
MHKYLEAGGIEKQLQLNGGKRAMERWAGNRGNSAKTKSKVVECFTG